MKNLLLIFLLSIFVIMNICCSSATTENYEKILKTWEGGDINRLLMSWGAPSDEYTMPNGNKMYTWLYVSGSRVITNYNWYLDQISSRRFTYWCKTTFTVDEN